MYQKQLKEIIENGETEEVEFKKSTAQLEKGLRAICAFLNHKGGAVYFGIDNKTQVGQQVSDPTLRTISQKVRQKIKPEITPEITVHGDGRGKVIKVAVKEGLNKLYYLDGVAYKRVGTENPIIPPEEIERIITEKRKKGWDSEICEGACLKDIDSEKVKWFLRKAKYERNFEVDPETPVKEALERLKLIRNEKLTNAAVLLFGKDTQKFFLPAKIRCARFKGTEPLEFIDMKVFEGNIISQRDDALEFVKEHIKLHAKIVGTEREENWEYPIEAVREAITNAICHRDYEIASNVQIRIFNDRIEIWGCGHLPEPLKLEDLKRKHDSLLRNCLIGECFFLIKFVEEWGTGTNRILKECLDHGLPEPLFELIAENLVVTIRKYKITDEILKELKEEEKNIVNHILKHEKISRKEGVTILKVSPATVYRYFKSLENRGIIQRMGKGKNIYYVLM